MHSINCYIFRLDDKHSVKNYHKLPTPQNLGVALYKRGMPDEFIQVETDYFGGAGEQSAKIYSNRHYINVLGKQPINKALRYLGVVVDEDTNSL